MTNGTTPTIASQVPAGAVINNAYAGRNVRIYAVSENELNTIGLFNGLATTFFSVASGLASLAIGIWVSAAFEGELTPEGKVLNGYGAWIALFLAVILAALGIWAMCRKHSTLKAIKEEAKT